MTWTAGIITLLVSFILTAILGKLLIPFLVKLKFGQTIKEIGPTWHEKKSGTPTMGGVMFIVGITVAIIVGMVMLSRQTSSSDISGIEQVTQIRVWGGLMMALGFGLIGFIDDFIKVVKKRNLGLTALQKTVMQFVLAIGYVATMTWSHACSTIVIFPFFGQVDFGWLYYPLVVIGIYFMVNAVNLTDGIDGLASSVTVLYAISFMVITTLLFQDHMYVFASALAGGCLGFLIWNFYPAKVFMGDTGSMFLGGMVVALAFGVDMPVLMLLVGIVYVVEALSVVLQVISFKTTGKRIFKMSPIHHHFEMCHWSEVKIVSVFSTVTAIFGMIGIISIIMAL